MRCNPLRRFPAALALVLAAGSAVASTHANPLPELDMDARRMVVVGLSSGAYMAAQSHLAWPGTFSGAALVAGGPYGCSGGALSTALGSCMQGTPAPDIEALARRAIARADRAELGPVADLSGDRVLVMHGTSDTVVAPSVAHGAARFYEQMMALDERISRITVTWDGEREFGHNFPTAQVGDDCTASRAPYLGACGFDAAQRVFSTLFGEPPAAPSASGELRVFDQRRYRPDGDDAHLADEGYLYVPAACAAGEPCGLLVAFHGCNQDAATVGEAFVRDAGFNRWADRYQVAVLYPQVRASLIPLNPQSCWDWWGYSGDGFDTREGVQQRWLKEALAALGVVAR